MRPKSGGQLAERIGYLQDSYIPNSQKAAHTLGSAPAKTDLRRTRYMAQDAEGEPGRGRSGMRGGGETAAGVVEEVAAKSFF